MDLNCEDKSNQIFLKIQSEIQMTYAKTQKMTVLGLGVCHQPTHLWLVLGSPVPRLKKDWDWTGPRLEKTGKSKTGQDWRLEKTAQRPVFMDRSLWLRPVWTGDFVPLIYPSRMSPIPPKTIEIWLRNKFNCTMLTKIVEFAEYYCIKFNS